jgi:hypothetical protein
VAPVRAPWWHRLGIVGLGLALASTAAVLLVAGVPGKREGLPDDMRAKGAQVPQPAITVALTCSGGSPAACPRGARLAAAFAGAPAAGYVGAFAEPAGGGEPIWYFSAEDGPAVLGPREGDVRMASRSAVVGPEHRGRYAVHVVLSSRPLSRAEILDAGTPGVLLRTAVTLVVTGP